MSRQMINEPFLSVLNGQSPMGWSLDVPEDEQCLNGFSFCLSCDESRSFIGWFGCPLAEVRECANCEAPETETLNKVIELLGIDESQLQKEYRLDFAVLKR